MMDQKYLAEIKARLKRGDYYVPYAPEDITALLAEVESLNEQHQRDAHNLSAMQITLDQQAKNCENLLAAKDQQIAELRKELQASQNDFNRLNEGGLKQIATLKKALGLACGRIESRKCKGCDENCGFCALTTADYYIRQAQEQEAAK